MFDPWTIIGANPWIEVHHVRMPDGKPGATDGHQSIWLDDRLTVRERRCVLTHELVHLQYGHASCQSPKHEWKVRRETAHLLIPWPSLIRASADHMSLSDLADDLNVTSQLLQDRLQTVSPLEAALLKERGATIAFDATW
ncbi:hypothetical protein AQ436_01680 [Arthrobacter sp. EpRS66]|nr:hypothetical protein AQ436_01680 [Arthrobacter sp. EpRS66]